MTLKSEILEGAKPKPFKSKTLGREVMLRRLTVGESAEVTAVVMGGQSLAVSDDEMEQIRASRKGNKPAGESKEPAAPSSNGMRINMDLGVFMRQEAEAKALAVSYALVDDEPWTVDDVKAIPEPGALDELGDEVLKRSKVSLEAVRSFRGKR